MSAQCPHGEKVIELASRLQHHEEKLGQFELAFPDGPVAHRMAHEGMIREALQDSEFMYQLKLEAAKKGMWFLLLVLAGLLVIGVQIKLKSFLGIGA